MGCCVAAKRRAAGVFFGGGSISDGLAGAFDVDVRDLLGERDFGVGIGVRSDSLDGTVGTRLPDLFRLRLGPSSELDWVGEAAGVALEPCCRPAGANMRV
jgi:hypothetical protein